MRIFPIITLAIGTYLMRYLPMRFREGISKHISPEFLEYSATALISVLFLNSFVSSINSPHGLIRGVVSIAAASFVWKFFRNLGTSILVGVLAYYVCHLICAR